MIVVDVHVLVYAAIEGDFTALANRISQKDSQWLAPPLWRSEFRNVLASSMRRGRATLTEANAAMDRAELLLAGEPIPGSRDILSLAAVSRCTAYDLEYVAVARALGVPLVTNDRQILTNFPAIAVSLESFTAGTA